MTIVQSLDTSLIRDVNMSSAMFTKVDNYALTIRMSVLSHLKLIEHYRGQYPIVFFADDYAYPVLKEIFPHTVRKFTDYLPLNKTNIWTRSKINCLKIVKGSVLHIDNDIIFKKYIDLSQAEQSTIFVERIEDKYTFNWYSNGIRYIDNAINIYKSKEYCDLEASLKYWRPDLTFAYNCGMLGFNNEKVKDTFVDLYNELEDVYSWRLLFEPYYEQIFVVLEQYALNCLANKEQIKVNCLLEGVMLEAQSNFAEKLGYVHLFGGAKFLKSNVDKIDKTLKDEYPAIYDILTKYELNLKQ